MRSDWLSWPTRLNAHVIVEEITHVRIVPSIELNRERSIQPAVAEETAAAAESRWWAAAT